jgi:hypothetical protein
MVVNRWATYRVVNESKCFRRLWVIKLVCGLEAHWPAATPFQTCMYRHLNIRHQLMLQTEQAEEWCKCGTQWQPAPLTNYCLQVSICRYYEQLNGSVYSTCLVHRAAKTECVGPAKRRHSSLTLPTTIRGKQTNPVKNAGLYHCTTFFLLVASCQVSI